MSENTTSTVPLNCTEVCLRPSTFEGLFRAFVELLGSVHRRCDTPHLTSPKGIVARAISSALTLAPSLRLNRLSFPSCLRRPPRCRGKQALEAIVVHEEATPTREHKEEREEAEKGRKVLGWFTLDRIGLDILGTRRARARRHRLHRSSR